MPREPALSTSFKTAFDRLVQAKGLEAGTGLEERPAI